MPEVTQSWESDEERPIDPDLMRRYKDLEARYAELKAEADAAKETASQDPLAPENIPVVQLITILRIYDILGALLNKLDPKMAEEVLNGHENGKILGPSPRIVP